MIKGVHAMFYSPEAETLRAFFRDQLQISNFDAGGGWPIFTPAEGEIGFHPAEKSAQDISLYCDDIATTVTELKSRGVEFKGEVENHGYGLVTFILAPGGFEIQLYQPLYK